MRPISASVSLALHLAAVIAMWFLGLKVGGQIAKPVNRVVIPLIYHPAAPPADADGGGGQRDLLPPSKGRPPSRPATRVFVPPMMTASMPKLPVSAALLDAPPPELRLASLGDPLGRSGVLSGGPGGPGGIGTGCCGGVGPGSANRAGGDPRPPRESARSGYITAPQLIHKVEPEYPDEARKSRYQGTVQISAEIDLAGRPANIRVLHGLGLGLDERAVEAVAQWRFHPAMSNGQPVKVSVVIEVSFHLL